MSKSRHLFFLMNHIFIGFAIAVAYGAIVGAVIWWQEGAIAFSKFISAFVNSFNCVISGGLILSTAILVYKSQNWVPKVIEQTFSPVGDSNEEYIEQRRRYRSRYRSLSFMSTFIIVGFGVFWLVKFPLTGIGHYALLAFACLEYGLGVYVGRKLFYIAQMMHSIEDVEVDDDIFTNDKLGLIPVYVNSITTLTAIFVYVHVYAYYTGPFLFTSPIGDTAKIFLLIPAVV